MKMEATIHGLALRGLTDIVPIMEHQIEKTMESGMDTAVYIGFVWGVGCRITRADMI